MNVAQEIIAEQTGVLSRTLPDITTMSDEDIALVLLTYQGVIEPNFVPWMAKVWTKCVSEVALSACYDNLLCEVKENHPLMLRQFVEPARELVPRIRVKMAVNLLANVHWRSGETFINLLDRYCSSGAGSGAPHGSGLAVLATLEGTSFVFIPWLDVAARRLGIADRTYIEKHGLADARHAQQFVAAMIQEANVMQIPINRKACVDTTSFVRAIFNIHQNIPSVS